MVAFWSIALLHRNNGPGAHSSLPRHVLVHEHPSWRNVIRSRGMGKDASRSLSRDCHVEYVGTGM